jgi:adenylyltransferase/sulfurtransferase
MALRDDQVRRYARHILLPEVGGVGQERLLAAEVAVDVAPPGAAAAVALAYLAAAGVGTLRLCGDTAGAVGADEAAGSILLGPADVGRPRGEAIAARLRALNPDVAISPVPEGGRPGGGGPAVLCIPAAKDVASALVAGGAAAAARIAAIARGPA